MSVTRSQLTGGPAYANFNSQNIQFTEDSTVETALVTDIISASLYGDVDEIYKDLVVKAVGRPLFYDTAALATMFPYLTGVVGTVFPGGTDKPCTWNSNNGDVITLTSALIHEMARLGGPSERYAILEDTYELHCSAQNAIQLRTCEAA